MQTISKIRTENTHIHEDLIIIVISDIIKTSRPGKPTVSVGPQTLARWVKCTLSKAGINTNIFTAHSTRHASTSAALDKGVSIEIIKDTAGWFKRSQVFARYYKRPIVNNGENAFIGNIMDKKSKQFNLEMTLDKSEFLRKEVPFLGHIITPDGIKPNPEKIKAIVEYSIPKTQKEIKAFLAVSKEETINIKDTNYIEAFNKCKELITNAPTLQYPDFDKKFHITSDASNVVVGAVLFQGGHPNSFFSRTLNSAEQNYSTIEKELLAIVEACRNFRPYVYGRKFIIETDHKPLRWLWSLKIPNSKFIRWMIKLEEYDYEVKYRKGCKNHVAHGLRRVEINVLESDNDEDDLISMILQNSENEQHSNESCADDETMHTSEENQSFTLPITHKNIHF
uniref:Reverse transcriptase RNase H-like domain-containing protein n=1 Tax=Trichogramma kaykai TaxID=54128 RepID=A0ABD2W254_9HYME